MEGIAMAGRSQEKGIKELEQDRGMGADYYAGYPEEVSGKQEETHIPYKLEPNATEIENFLTRLRQEGL